MRSYQQEERMYVVLAERTYFGETGKTSYGFITERLLLVLKRDKIGGRERFDFKDLVHNPIFFSDYERIKFFRTQETAQRWCDEHTCEINGEPCKLIAVRYGSLMRNPFE